MEIQEESRPVYESENTPITTAREAKALLVALIPNRLRFKCSEDPADRDLERQETEISIGDHTALVTYLLDYFSSQEGGEPIDFSSAFDMVLAHDLGDIAQEKGIIGIKKTKEDEKRELNTVANILSSFPDHFKEPLTGAYSAYLARESKEAGLVRGLSGLATMLYVLWKGEDASRAFVAGNGYTKQDYRERIGVYCEDHAELKKMYALLERFFTQQGYFNTEETGSKRPPKLTPEEKVSFFTEAVISRGQQEKNNAKEDELQALSSLYAIKHTRRFEKPPREKDDHHDTVPEHVALLLFLGRYFLPLEQEQNPELDLRTIVRMTVLHDAPEGITGDKRTFEKTAKDGEEEEQAMEVVAKNYLPRLGKYNQKALEINHTYEKGKGGRADGNGFVDKNATFVKMLDIFEGELQVFDPTRRDKLTKIAFLNRETLQRKLDPYRTLFPTTISYFDELLSLIDRELPGLRRTP